MRAVNRTNNCLIAQKVLTADSFFSRARGLLNNKFFPEDEALLITHCQSIHMFLMKFSIDVLFLDKITRVVGVVEKIQPFHLSPIFWRATSALELAAGVIGKTKTSVGDQLEIE